MVLRGRGNRQPAIKIKSRQDSLDLQDGKGAVSMPRNGILEYGGLMPFMEGDGASIAENPAVEPTALQIYEQPKSVPNSFYRRVLRRLAPRRTALCPLRGNFDNRVF